MLKNLTKPTAFPTDIPTIRGVDSFLNPRGLAVIGPPLVTSLNSMKELKLTHTGFSLDV